MAFLPGTDGNDNLSGTSLADTIFGFAGFDTLSGSGGNDSIDGGEDDDVIYGGAGNDTLLGANGLDSIGGDAGDDTINGGNDTDLALYDIAPSAVHVSLTTNTASGGDGNDVLISIEGVIGSGFNDTLTGNNDNNTLVGAQGDDLLTGLDGNDYLEGDAGTDTLLGGNGDDFLYGFSGNDSIDGGSGLDTALYDLAASQFTITQQGSNIVVTHATNGVDTLAGVEHLTFSDYVTETNRFFVTTSQGNGLAAVEVVASLFGAAALADGTLFGQTLALLEGGLTMEEAVGAAVSSDRFATAAGSHSNSDFVNFVYHNVAGFFPDAGTHDLLTHLLDTGYYTQAQLGALAADIRGGSGFIQEVTPQNLSIIAGTEGVDAALTGTAAANYIVARGGNDVISGGAGSDVINGGTGIDRALYTGAKSAYTVTVSDAGLSVKENATVDKDTLESVERLTFSNTSVAYDIDGNAGIAAKVVTAMFGLAGLQDKGVVGTYLAMLDSGMSYEAVASAAAASTLFANQAGGHSNAQFVDHVFFNLVGFHPSAEVAQQYIDILNTPGYSQGYLGMLAADTSYNLANVNLTGLAQAGLEYTLS
ncbi:calcium-binding protein [Caenimonas koreensis]|uniref:calcium-binding protein n=1 Tax=Caenimonas koreensis TaxID=367474 RepID=UPI0037834624